MDSDLTDKIYGLDGKLDELNRGLVYTTAWKGFSRFVI